MADDSLGHITLRSVIGHYTSALAKSGKKSDAIDSQSKLIALYRRRGVISSVIKVMEEAVAKMK